MCLSEKSLKRLIAVRKAMVFAERRLLPTWTSLLAFSRSSLARWAFVWIALVPAAAQFLLGVENTVQVEFLGHQWGLHLTLPFSWQAFFFASLFAAAAACYVTLTCPPMIRDFKDYAGFTHSGRGVDQIIDEISAPESLELYEPEFWDVMRTLADIGHVEAPEDRKEFATQFRDLVQAAIDQSRQSPVGPAETSSEQWHALRTALLQLSHRKDALRRMFWAVRTCVNRSRTAHRFVASLLICGSIYFVAIVASGNYYTVYNYDRIHAAKLTERRSLVDASASDAKTNGRTNGK